MFRIVVLLKAISIRKSLLNKQKESVLKDAVDVEISPHNSSEDQDWRCTALWYTGPHMHLVRMLYFRLQCCRHTLLLKAKPSVTFHPYAWLIRKDDIIIRFASRMTWQYFGPVFFHPNLFRAAFTAETDSWMPHSVSKSRLSATGKQKPKIKKT